MYKLFNLWIGILFVILIIILFSNIRNIIYKKIKKNFIEYIIEIFFISIITILIGFIIVSSIEPTPDLDITCNQTYEHLNNFTLIFTRLNFENKGNLPAEDFNAEIILGYDRDSKIPIEPVVFLARKFDYISNCYFQPNLGEISRPVIYQNNSFKLSDNIPLNYTKMNCKIIPPNDKLEIVFYEQFIRYFDVKAWSSNGKVIDKTIECRQMNISPYVKNKQLYKIVDKLSKVGILKTYTIKEKLYSEKYCVLWNKPLFCNKNIYGYAIKLFTIIIMFILLLVLFINLIKYINKLT